MGLVSQVALDELKHSIRMHLLVMQGPSQQLCAMLLKMPDIMGDEDTTRRDKEALELAFVIVEGLALYVQRYIDDKASHASNNNMEFPKNAKLAGDNILVAVGMFRNNEDKVQSKNAVLRSVSEALKALSASTNNTYPEIYDSNGVKF